MQIKNSILAVLQDGLWHSEDELCEKLDESDSSAVDVCAWLRQEKQTFDHSASGYMWCEPAGLISSERVLTMLEAELPGRLHSSRFFDVCGSTSDEVRSLDFGGGYAVCSAEAQTSGRGRRGERWVSPVARNLYFSLRYEVPAGNPYPKGLSLSVGVVIARAIKAGCGVPVKVKWPNDLYVLDRKLGGILVEISVRPNGNLDVIVGVGINANMASWTEEVGQPWISLEHEVGTQDRSELLGIILRDLIASIDDFEASRDGILDTHWSEVDVLLDRELHLLLNGQRALGVGKGIDNDYGYQIEIDGDLVSVDSSDASLRLI